MDDQTWNPPTATGSAPNADAPTDTVPVAWPAPSEPVPPAAFAGRTPGRSGALRAGAALGAVLVIAVGAAAVLGASPSGSAGNGAGGQPAAGASGGTAPDRGNGRGLGGGRRGLFGFGVPGGPSAPGPFGGPGLGLGRGGPNGPFARLGLGAITVTGISGSDISLKTADGWTRTITVSSSTTITKGGQPAVLGDIKVGDTVRFTEARNADGSFSITSVAIVLPETAGTVTAVGSDTITITTRDGTSATIRTTGSTTYRLGGATGARSDVKVGSIIGAVGERGSDGQITASTVQIVLPRVLGMVTAVGSDTLTLRRPDGTTITVHVGSGTSIAVGGTAGSTLSDVKVGMLAAVQGTQRSDGSLDASAIRAGQGGKLRPAKPQQPAAPGATSSPSTTNG